MKMYGNSAMKKPKNMAKNSKQKKMEKKMDSKKMDSSLKGSEKMGHSSKEKLTAKQKSLPKKLQDEILKKKKKKKVVKK